MQRFAVRLNVVVLAVVAALALAFGGHGLLLFTAVYSCISLWHAHGLGRAASAIDAVLGEELEVVSEASRYAGSTIKSGAPSSTSDSSITRTALTFPRAGSPSPP